MGTSENHALSEYQASALQQTVKSKKFATSSTTENYSLELHMFKTCGDTKSSVRES